MALRDLFQEAEEAVKEAIRNGEVTEEDDDALSEISDSITPIYYSDIEEYENQVDVRGSQFYDPDRDWLDNVQAAIYEEVSNHVHSHISEWLEDVDVFEMADKEDISLEEASELNPLLAYLIWLLRRFFWIENDVGVQTYIHQSGDIYYLQLRLPLSAAEALAERYEDYLAARADVNPQFSQDWLQSFVFDYLLEEEFPIVSADIGFSRRDEDEDGLVGDEHYDPDYETSETVLVRLGKDEVGLQLQIEPDEEFFEEIVPKASKPLSLGRLL